MKIIAILISLIVSISAQDETAPTMTIATTLEITPEVTTLAGSGSQGSANGTGTAAAFYLPTDVALDGSGNMYVADYNNHLIRKITSAGVVTTFAGSGSEGSADGTGTAASFNQPVGVAVDGSGNVYVADYTNHLIRKITSAGVVTTLAGSGSQGSTNGTGTAASFYHPTGVAVDGSGNVYVGDAGNHLIRKITSAGVVTTLAGSGSLGSANGEGTAASFNYPSGVAVDGSGNVYVGDWGNHLIRKIATTLASGSTTNDATLPLIFTSNEVTTNFAVADITVTNGALSSFAPSSSTVYTATFTPTAEGAVTIDVAAGTFTDAAGNNNTAATQFNWTYDVTVPTISSVSLASDNSTIAVTMSVAVYNTSGGSGSLETSDFSFSISGGTATLSSATPSSISASGNVYTLGIELSGIPDGSEVLKVNPNYDSIYDAAGNAAAASQSNNTAILNKFDIPAMYPSFGELINLQTISINDSYTGNVRASMAGTDIDQDGKKEIFVALWGNNGGSVKGYEIDKNAKLNEVWNADQYNGQRPYSSDVRDVKVGDLDGDGLQEIIFFRGRWYDEDDKAGIYIYEWDGVNDDEYVLKQKFNLYTDYSDKLSYGYVENFIVNDVDNDGVQEIIIAHNGPTNGKYSQYSEDRFMILSLQGDLGNATLIEEFAFSPRDDDKDGIRDNNLGGGSPMDVNIIDFNQDGKNEIACIAWNNLNLIFIEVNGPDSYTIRSGTYKKFASRDDLTFKSTVADLNNDTYPELYFGGYYDGKAWVVYDIDYTFEEIFSTDDRIILGSASGDINNDGQDEIVFTGHDDSLLVWNGSILEKIKLVSNMVAIKPYITDINNDTVDDLILGSSISVTVDNSKPFLLILSEKNPNNYNFEPELTSINNFTINEDSLVEISLNGVDKGGDVLSYSVVSDTSSVVVTVSDELLSVEPALNWSGIANITAYVSDGTFEDSSSFILTVTPVNDFPVLATIPDDTTNEDTAKSVTLSATDVEGDALTYTGNSNTDKVTISISSTTMTLTPAADWNGVASITAYASDGTLKDSTSFTFTVASINDVAAINTTTIEEDASTTVTLSSTFSGTPTYSAKSDTSAITVSVSSTALQLTPSSNWNGTSTITAYASVGTLKDSTAFTLSVTAVNDAPVITAVADDSTNEETEKTIKLSATDIDGDALTYSATSDTSAVAITISTDTLKLNPALNYTGTSVITVIVSDNALADTTKFDFTVINVNDAPVIAAVANDTTSEDSDGKALKLSASDIDGDALTYSGIADTSAITVTSSNDTLELIPQANWNGSSMITAIASDGTASDSTTFTLTVTSVNDAPSFLDTTFNEDTSISIVYTIQSGVTLGAKADTSAIKFSMSKNNLSITPDADYFGSSTVTLTAYEGALALDSTFFTVSVKQIQDAPYAFDWVSTALDTIDISQSNLADTYELKWSESKDVDGETIDYLLYVKIGVLEPDEIYDTISTSIPITYQEFLENVFEPFPMLSRVTVQFSMEATDGIDTVKITGDNRVLFVNRYEYLSTVSEGIPTEFALHENYPNPFNPTTTLRFDLPQVSDITLTIYNMLGQRVRTFNYQNTSAGYHSVTWDATNDYGEQVGAGVYLYQLRAKQFVKTRKMVLLK